MAQGISEIIGAGTDAKGEEVPVYRALRLLLCSACGSPMQVGALFTRRAVPGIGTRIMPRCGRCAPFELREQGPPTPDEAVTAAKGSKLIENLLAPEEETPAGESEPRRDVSEEVARRLGPALSRSRQKSE